MAEFLLLLGKVNLALGVGVILVWLLRRVVRAQFGAPIAYALWLLVPVAGLACLLPPRTEVPVMQAAVLQNAAVQNGAVQNPAVQMPARQMPVTQMPAEQNRTAPATPYSAAPMPAPHPQPQTDSAARVRSVIMDEAATLDSLNVAPLLFAVWILGAGLMALYLSRLQLCFHAAEQAGEAGPAVAGFLRPRVVIPQDFPAQFTQAEQAAILAHERVHLARQDARINALSALLRALCWFNPLIHLADHWLRIDQELACDAAAMAGQVSRRDYANALLKSQITKTALPLGCNWPGSEHPLVERVALLKRKRPGPARRFAGFGLVMIAAASAGVGAWAAQPPVLAENGPAKSSPAPHTAGRIALATQPNTTASQNAPDAGQPLTDANSAPNPHGDATQNVPGTKSASASEAANTPAPNRDSAQTTSPVPALQDYLPKMDLAFNQAADAALAKVASDASGTLPNAAVAQEMAAGAAAQAGNVSGPKTEAGLDCMVGLGPQGCEKVFGKPADHQYSQCTTQRVQDNCPYGELETVEYLGTNAYGADVYGVNWRDLKSIFILPPPGQDGKIGHGPWRRTAADLRVTAPAGQLLYSRENACRQNNWDCAASPVAIAVSGPAPAGGLRAEVRQQLDRAEDLFKDGKPAAAMDVLRSVEAMPDLNRDEQRRAGIVRNFITPYSASAFRGPPGPNGGFDMPSAEELMRASPRVSSYLPPGDVGPNNPN